MRLCVTVLDQIFVKQAERLLFLGLVAMLLAVGCSQTHPNTPSATPTESPTPIATPTPTPSATPTATTPLPSKISPSAAKSILDNDQTAVFVDVRPKTDYDKEHIPGAISIPSEELQGRYNQIPTAAQIIVYAECLH